MKFEALMRALSPSCGGMAVRRAIIAHYLLTYRPEEQKQASLPLMAPGAVISAIAMTEPGAGSCAGPDRPGIDVDVLDREPGDRHGDGNRLEQPLDRSR